MKIEEAIERAISALENRIKLAEGEIVSAPKHIAELLRQAVENDKRAIVSLSSLTF